MSSASLLILFLASVVANSSMHSTAFLSKESSCNSFLDAYLASDMVLLLVFLMNRVFVLNLHMQ